MRRFCQGASIFRGAVEDVDLEAQTVRFSPGPFVPAATLKFEHLVLALGGVVDVSRVPGMPEHGYLMKTVARHPLAGRPDPTARRGKLEPRPGRAPPAADLRGGWRRLFGVETAGQISDLLRDVHRFYPRVDPKEFRLVLVHSGPYLLPQIGEKLGRYCGEHLQKRGIEVRLNSRVAALTAERAILDAARWLKPTRW